MTTRERIPRNGETAREVSENWLVHSQHHGMDKASQERTTSAVLKNGGRRSRSCANQDDPYAPLQPKSDAQWTPYTMRLRSEEHTSELQSRGHLVCRRLPEKKKR